jgi:hypothetical protein
MVLTEKGRAPRIREIVTYRLDKSGGETANLIHSSTRRTLPGLVCSVSIRPR